MSFSLPNCVIYNMIYNTSLQQTPPTARAHFSQVNTHLQIRFLVLSFSELFAKLSYSAAGKPLADWSYSPPHLTQFPPVWIAFALLSLLNTYHTFAITSRFQQTAFRPRVFFQPEVVFDFEFRAGTLFSNLAAAAAFWVQRGKSNHVVVVVRLQSQ